jgi:Flp pilus assembly secretin CpaC
MRKLFVATLLLTLATCQVSAEDQPDPSPTPSSEGCPGGYSATAAGPKAQAFAAVSSTEKNSGKQILLTVKLLEADDERLSRLGFDEKAEEADEKLPGVVDALVKDRLACVLAAPMLVVTLGRPASFRNGGQIDRWERDDAGELSQRPTFFGTAFDCTANLTKEGNIGLQFCLESSDVDRTETVVVAPGKTNPTIQTTVVESYLELKPGHTVTSWGLPQHGGRRTLWLVRADFATEASLTRYARVPPLPLPPRPSP